MGPLLVYFVAGSIAAVPLLTYQLLRTRRELSELRAELRQRGLIAPEPGAGPARVGAAAPGHLAGPPSATLPAPAPGVAERDPASAGRPE